MLITEQVVSPGGNFPHPSVCILNTLLNFCVYPVFTGMDRSAVKFGLINNLLNQRIKIPGQKSLTSTRETRNLVCFFLILNVLSAITQRCFIEIFVMKKAIGGSQKIGELQHLSKKIVIVILSELEF